MNHMDLELYNAVISRKDEVLKEIDGRLNVGDQLTPTNCTVLHLASQYGNITCVEEILNTHPSLLLKLNSRGETALHLAAREGNCDVAEALTNAAKSSLLQLDHLRSRTTTVLEFLTRTPNVEFETALHEAVRYNHVDVVELILNEDPNHPHPPNKNDETPLYLASVRGYTDIVTIILDNCVSPNYGGPDGRTALHAAILDHGGIECVKLLLEKRKDLVKIADNYGWTVFHYAAHNDHHTIMEDLVDVDKYVAYLADNKYKRTALHVAVYEGFVGATEKLLKYCPDSCGMVDVNGRNIMHIAVEQNHKEIIEYIAGNCREFNNLLIQKDKNGNTPLHLMAMLGCYVPQVIDHYQVDWEALNGENLTPLDVIHYSGETFLADQKKIRRKLMRANVKTHWNLGRRLKDPEADYENGKTLASHINDNNETVEHYRKMKDTHMIVAALVATVALTAGFAMPGGFDGNAGSKEGSPILLRKAAFKTFMITDTIALLCSLSSLFIYFMSVFYNDAYKIENVAVASVLLNILSIVAMMLAFITGTYAVLAHSSALAITVSVISSFFLLLSSHLLSFQENVI